MDLFVLTIFSINAHASLGFSCSRFEYESARIVLQEFCVLKYKIIDWGFRRLESQMINLISLISRKWFSQLKLFLDFDKLS